MRFENKIFLWAEKSVAFFTTFSQSEETIRKNPFKDDAYFC